MTVYGEFLFMENALSGAVILLLTGKLCGYKVEKGRRKYSTVPAVYVVFGSIVCGIYAFILFADIHWAAALGSRLLFSAAVVAVVFRPSNVKAFGKTAAVFYIVSFLMGGITISLMYMTDLQGMTANGSIYFYGIRYLQIMAGILVSAAAGIWLADHLKEKMRKEAVMTDVSIHIGEHRWDLKAFVDTGNFLVEPVSGYPAVLVSAAAGKKIIKALGRGCGERCCVIPYRGVGRKGILYGLRPDGISVEGRRISKVVIALNEDDFAPWKGTDAYDVLLQQQLFEGRI